MSTNAKIIEAFERLREKRIRENEPFRARAYSRAIDSILSYPKEITSVEEARKLPGIGVSLGNKIGEILTTGRIKELEEDEDLERDEVIKLFMSLDEVGPVTANKWYDAGFRSLDELAPSMLTRAQNISLSFRDEFNRPIPRDEIRRYETALHRCLDPHNIEFVITGAYRRGEKESYDIEVAAVNKPGVDVMKQVTSCPVFVPELTLTSGPKRFQGVGKLNNTSLHRRIDVKLVEPEELSFALLYLTGPSTFYDKLRAHASNYGLTLNERGLFGPNEEFYPAKDEQDLFDILGIVYLTPEQRNEF